MYWSLYDLVFCFFLCDIVVFLYMIVLLFVGCDKLVVVFEVVMVVDKEIFFVV